MARERFSEIDKKIRENEEVMKPLLKKIKLKKFNHQENTLHTLIIPSQTREKKDPKC